mmetsp:Transcript_11070/g.12671  ORF Transcript_11070/g.12671 Transcript_11070/m.12671 type:complete len:189 (-) Transcript_11070:1545-2111(-)|eukprot:CAMPEP_0184012652 /NCGR_PEP_ID=MMETSP0954-20121128/4549_1 /TAXON_ID=627963 /ORGANISM="Aplanochytrium sp, Strain PBS07" /LENGTH=188 /DNA_ID=CAMNT_0026292699 /DNA_START=95 /DNA_END=661 /DNA_ORIENTATION=+
MIQRFRFGVQQGRRVAFTQRKSSHLLRSFFSDKASGTITDENELPMSDFAVAVARARDIELREKHHAFIEEYPESAQPDVGGKVDPLYAHKKKLIYRSKQRGWLEVDLLMGSWAEDNVMSLSEDELKQYENIINQETLDIFNIVTKQMEPPVGLDGPILQRLQEYALTSPAGVADPKKYSEIKKKMSN